MFHHVVLEIDAIPLGLVATLLRAAAMLTSAHISLSVPGLGRGGVPANPLLDLDLCGGDGSRLYRHLRHHLSGGGPAGGHKTGSGDQAGGGQSVYQGQQPGQSVTGIKSERDIRDHI